MVLEVVLEFPSLAVKEGARRLHLAQQPCLQGQPLEALEVTFPTFVTSNFQKSMKLSPEKTLYQTPTLLRAASSASSRPSGFDPPP